MTQEHPNNFDQAFEHVLGVEGGYTNDPFDHGGPTNWGITQDTLAAFRGRPVTEKDVKNLSMQEAKLIYRARYWNPLGCDRIKSAILATLLFDQGVNRGIGAAARTMQSLLGVTVDGMVGPKTIDAINSEASKTLACSFLFASQESYARIVQNDPTQAKFIVGWLRRTHKLFELVLKA